MYAFILLNGNNHVDVDFLEQGGSLGTKHKGEN